MTFFLKQNFVGHMSFLWYPCFLDFWSRFKARVECAGLFPLIEAYIWCIPRSSHLEWHHCQCIWPAWQLITSPHAYFSRGRMLDLNHRPPAWIHLWCDTSAGVYSQHGSRLLSPHTCFSRGRIPDSSGRPPVYRSDVLCYSNCEKLEQFMKSNCHSLHYEKLRGICLSHSFTSGFFVNFILLNSSN